jgi:putative transposase
MATSDITTPALTGQILTFKVRAYPTKAQHARLADYLTHTRQLYNAALEERIGCYQKTRRTISNAEQSRGLTELRQSDPAYAAYPRRMQRWAINLVEAAYQGMFTRHRNGERGRQIGFPRYRGYVFWNTLGWDSPIQLTMRERGLHSLQSFGGTLRLRPDRELPAWDRCKAVTLCRDGDRWFANLSYEMPPVAVKDRAPMRPVGLDLGLITLAMRSDGVPMNVPRQSAEDTAAKRRAGRALSRCKKRSKRRRKVRAQLRRVEARIARRRKAKLHVISARLTHHWDAVAVEDLNIAGMNQGGGGGAAGRGIRKSWRDRAPGALVDMLKWKTKRDGRPMAAVDARYTTIECSRCGVEVRKRLRDRTHVCTGCGLVLDRDHNAALNIVARAGWGPLDAKLSSRAGVKVPAGRVGLSMKHGSGNAAGPRRVGADAQPPPSTPTTQQGTRSRSIYEGCFPGVRGWTGAQHEKPR